MGVENAKFLAPPGFETRTVQPVASRYTDYKVPVLVSKYVQPNVNLSDIKLFLVTFMEEYRFYDGYYVSLQHAIVLDSKMYCRGEKKFVFWKAIT